MTKAKQISRKDVKEMPKGKEYKDLTDWDVIRLQSDELAQIARPMGAEFLVQIVEAEVNDVEFLNNYLSNND